MIGKKFGKLTVVDLDYVNRFTEYYICKCTCGNKKIVTSGSLRNWKIKSCGKCNYKDLKGKRFGKLMALDPALNDGNIKKASNGAIIWKCRCECGRIKEVSSGNLNRGCTSSCGNSFCNGNIKDLTNKGFGKLVVLGPAKDKNGDIKKNSSSIIWKCKCECGRTKEIISNNLIHGHTKSCGKCKYDLRGHKFDKLVVIESAKDKNNNIKKASSGAIIWKCLCECGAIKEVRSGHLKSGDTKTCGKCNYDLTNKKFGKLTALSLVEDKSRNIKRRTIWKCKCECGTITEVRYDSLKSGVTKSCGCIICSRNISQNTLANFIEKIYNTKICQNYRDFDWLRNPRTGYNLEVDIYVPELKLAIEYDGEQHFRPVSFGGMSDKVAKKDFKNRLRKDSIKNKKIKQHIENHGNDIEYFIRFNYKDKLTEENIISILEKQKVPIY